MALCHAEPVNKTLLASLQLNTWLIVLLKHKVVNSKEVSCSRGHTLTDGWDVKTRLDKTTNPDPVAVGSETADILNQALLFQVFICLSVIHIAIIVFKLLFNLLLEAAFLSILDTATCQPAFLQRKYSAVHQTKGSAGRTKRMTAEIDNV